MGFHKVIGIDLGTTYSVVAAYNFDKQDVQVIPNRQGERTTPSVVYISKQKQVSVGRAAKDKLSRDPDGVIMEVKRIMGDATPDRRKAMAKAAGMEFDPEFISAHILKELKACAERLIGEPVHDAVITVPAYFRESQKNATREAAKLARLNPRLIMNEPTAAAVAYGLEAGERQTFVVYDLGGGTFDVSVVRVEDERTAVVLGTGGNARLGGGDIDELITKWAFEQIKREIGQDLSRDGKLVGRLRLEAEKVKITLCNEGQAQELVIEHPTADVDELTFTLSPTEFEAMCRSILDRTMTEVDVALASARSQHGLELDDVDAFILVGGSSKIPAVAKTLAARYKKPIKSNLNPDEIVAMGAARMGLNYDPSLAAEVLDGGELKIDAKAAVPEHIASTNIKDVVSHTLGIGLVDDVYDPLIPKDHVIPHKVVRGGYTTAKDNQTSIFVPVYQGDNPKASQNTALGQVVIDGLVPEPKGTHQFQITFALDADGIFAGQILHVQKGTVKDIKLDRGDGNLTEKKRLDLADMVQSGVITQAPPDPVTKLVLQAHEMLPSLPPDRQREIMDALQRVTEARAGGNKEALATAMSKLTMLIMRDRQ
jgi:molecular chaperone DnaK